MKLNLISSSKTKKTELVRPKIPGPRQVEVWHTQEIKVSANYQSASCSYGVKLVVDDNDKAIQDGIKRAEDLVEAPLVGKVEQQRELLANLGQ